MEDWIIEVEDWVIKLEVWLFLEMYLVVVAQDILLRRGIYLEGWVSLKCRFLEGYARILVQIYKTKVPSKNHTISNDWFLHSRTSWRGFKLIEPQAVFTEIIVWPVFEKSEWDSLDQFLLLKV